MNTPIVDFVKNYIENENTLRLHMPGHKGFSLTGFEKSDITEIPGADSLYEAGGIIAESEDNASELFGAKTFYSTEGSSLCIRAMLYLALMNHRKRVGSGADVQDKGIDNVNQQETMIKGKGPWVLAGRNAHKTFLSAVALLDLDVEWLYQREEESYLSCNVTAEDVETVLRRLERCQKYSSEEGGYEASMPIAVYLTSPDYLGNRVDISAIAKVCHKYGVLLLVDNAHGAYLKFLPESEHPIDLGADMCCDSAHKTLPALTGAAYLHVEKQLSEICAFQVKNAMALFGSTSPSYLILQSLDKVNSYLAEGYKEKLREFIKEMNEVKEHLQQAGFQLVGNEPLKITIDAKVIGYSGYELGEELSKQNMVCEFADPDYLVLMLTPEIGKMGLLRLEQALCDIQRGTDKTAHKLCQTAKKTETLSGIHSHAPLFHRQEQAVSIREAMFSPSELLPVERCEGRILSVATVGCPPAVPIVICGERIDAHAIKCLQYYGIENCHVVCE